MSRKICFRAWKDGKMYFQEYCGGFSYFIEPSSSSKEEQDAFSLEDIFVLADNGGCILQQYTGLQDSTGKEIYEGDIFESGSSYKWEPVEFKDGKFIVNLTGARLHDLSELFDGYWNKKPKVIGNLFENPELL